MPFTARLDDLRPSDVLAAIDEVEAASRRGLWAVGFVGYEAASAFDGNLAVRPRTAYHDHLPLAWFGLYKTRILNPDPDPHRGSYRLSDWRWADTREEYERDVSAIRERIVAGDTYQVNYTTRLRASFSGDPNAFYHDLAAAQSGGYGTFLDTGRFQIASASPELFFDRYPTGRGRDRLITRPMKGTAARGRWAADDERRRDELSKSAKDRAENLIIVDLLRNDLGRLANFGTVSVDELHSIERYDTVWQMVSAISGEISSETPLRDVFGALFPCGSITGAPKVRTMEIIADLESESRGVYTGAIGFVGPPDVPGPRASFSVGIRTVVIDSETGEAEYGVGGGITYDSDPASEYEEARLKASILGYGRSDFALLETLRWNPVSGWYWLDRHLDRLASSAQYFGVPLDRNKVVARLEQAVVDLPESRVRLTVDRVGQIHVSVMALGVTERNSVAVAIDPEPVDTSSPFLFHKTTRRDAYDERSRRHPDAEDVLLVNSAGELTESTIANVVVKLDGTWYTPPITSGCLPGVYRGVLLAEHRIEERPIAVAEIEGCEGIALINSVRLWRPAFLLDA